MTKVVGYRVSDENYNKIKILDCSHSDFLCTLVDKFFFKVRYHSIIDVNRENDSINSKTFNVESSDNDTKWM